MFPPLTIEEPATGAASPCSRIAVSPCRRITFSCLRDHRILLALFVFIAVPAFASPDKVTVPNELTTKNVRTEESNLADLVAEAILKGSSADAAFIAASSFNEITLPKGTATVDDVLKALAFKSDTIVLVKLTGAQIKKALTHGLSLYPQRHSAFLQVAGITANIDGGAPEDKRVVSVKIGGSAVDDKKTYVVAMPSPLANGALAYYKIWTKSDIERDTGQSLEDAVTSYLKNKSTIGDRIEERLVFKK